MTFPELEHLEAGEGARLAEHLPGAERLGDGWVDAGVVDSDQQAPTDPAGGLGSVLGVTARAVRYCGYGPDVAGDITGYAFAISTNPEGGVALTGLRALPDADAAGELLDGLTDEGYADCIGERTEAEIAGELASRNADEVDVDVAREDLPILIEHVFEEIVGHRYRFDLTGPGGEVVLFVDQAAFVADRYVGELVTFSVGAPLRLQDRENQLSILALTAGVLDEHP